jgi:hypothetical protein
VKTPAFPPSNPGPLLPRITPPDTRFPEFCAKTGAVLHTFSGTSSLNTVLEYVDELDIEDQQYVQEIIRSRLIEKRRSAIVLRAKQAKTACKKNQSRSGTAKDLLADLNG